MSIFWTKWRIMLITLPKNYEFSAVYFWLLTLKDRKKAVFEDKNLKIWRSNLQGIFRVCRLHPVLPCTLPCLTLPWAGQGKKQFFSPCPAQDRAGLTCPVDTSVSYALYPFVVRKYSVVILLLLTKSKKIITVSAENIHRWFDLIWFNAKSLLLFNKSSTCYFHSVHQKVVKSA